MSSTANWNPSARKFNAEAWTNKSQQQKKSGNQGRKNNANNNIRSRSDVDNWRPKAASSGNANNAAAPKPQQPRVLPAQVPEDSALGQFLKESDAPCNDLAYIERLQELPCELKLADKWVFWLESAEPGPLPEKPQRDDFLKLLNISRTVSNLQKAKEYALQACEHPDNAKIFLFKQGIKPVWEDRSNYNGGRLFVTCTNKAVAVNTFVTLVIKLLAGKILADSELTGLTVSFTGSHRFTVQVWNRNSAEKDKIRDARKVMKKLFKKNVSYQVHRTSLKIYKYGYEQVMPEIEKAQAEKEAKRSTAPASAKQAPDEGIILAEEEPQETILDQASKAILAAALNSAWETRSGPTVSAN
jgi:hypothetical protein